MNINIRPAIEKDLPAILSLYAQPDVDNDKTLPIQDAIALFKKMTLYPNYHLYVATLDNHIVGTFALLVMDNLAHLGAPSGIVEDVMVDPNFQGKGIGKSMMDFAMETCKKAGCYKLVLSSNLKRTRAHQFYESLGFKQHGVSFFVE